MKSNPVRNRRLGLVLLVTTAIICDHLLPVIFDVTKEEPGTYIVQIDRLTGSFEILSVPQAVFTFANLQVSPATIEAGEQVTISVEVTNTGEAVGTQTVTLKINSAVEATKDVTISAGASQPVSFTVTRDQEGDYTVDIDGQAGTFEVTSAPGAPIGLIIGIVVVLLIVGGGAAYYFLVMRKQPPKGEPPPGEQPAATPPAGATPATDEPATDAQPGGTP